MVTPKLEELILKGRAFFKTFVAGGGQKSTLEFGDDRFIVITDITYFPMRVQTEGESFTNDNHNTQVSIYGNRGFNHYIFRNFLTHPNNRHQVMSPITIDTYIMHTEAVGFSFSSAPIINATFSGVAPEFATAYAPPLEYGKNGDPGAFPVVLEGQTDQGVGTYIDRFVTKAQSGVPSSQQLQFPVNSSLAFPSTNIQANEGYPLMLVNYVEILGLPNNLGI
jgi:hypothetical protein